MYCIILQMLMLPVQQGFLRTYQKINFESWKPVETSTTPCLQLRVYVANLETRVWYFYITQQKYEHGYFKSFDQSSKNDR